MANDPIICTPFLVLKGEICFSERRDSGTKMEGKLMEVEMFKWEGGKEMEEEGQSRGMDHDINISKPDNW